MTAASFGGTALRLRLAKSQLRRLRYAYACGRYRNDNVRTAEQVNKLAIAKEDFEKIRLWQSFDSCVPFRHFPSAGRVCPPYNVLSPCVGNCNV